VGRDEVRSDRTAAGRAGPDDVAAAGVGPASARRPAVKVASDPRLDPRRSLGMPWLVLCLALAIHVAEEIGSGFLASYELALESMRRLVPYVESPHISLTIWLAASIGLVLLLALLTPLAYRGARGMRTLMLWVIGLALANVLGYVGGSVLAGWPIPGVYSTAALAAACAYAIVADRRRAAAVAEQRGAAE
jgi:hypothetical protein